MTFANRLVMSEGEGVGKGCCVGVVVGFNDGLNVGLVVIYLAWHWPKLLEM